MESQELKTCQAGECRGRVFQYELVSRGSCTNPIVDIEECAAAAVSLGLSDTIATDDGQYSEWYSAWWDPPYCYFEFGSLKFNSGGHNTGSCSNTDACLCNTRGR